MDNYLQHHGVKGQEWGVRHGPPYPIEDKVMRKGHKLSNISVSKNGANPRRALYTYNTEDTHDAKIYKGPFAIYKLYSTGKMLCMSINMK